MKQKNDLNIYWAVYLMLSLFFAGSSMAQDIAAEQDEAFFGDWKPVEVTGDAIPWEVFATTKEIEKCIVDQEGYDYCTIKPGYSKDVKKHDGKKVTLMGFMFPLEQSEMQKNFLMGPYPLSCPFHYHVGPAQVIEVLADKPVAFSYDPITVTGILRLRYNEETGMFYYLEKAVP